VQSHSGSKEPRTSSRASSLASLPLSKRAEFLASLGDDEASLLLYDWSFWGRPDQFAPAGDWSTWAVIAGRGWGKTKTGAEFVRQEVEAGRAGRIALVAETAADARDVMVEGDSGILAVSPPWNRPIYEPSKRRVTWTNGAIATTFSAEDPDQLRGPQHDLAWGDELAKWRYGQDTWDNLQFGLRRGLHPRQIITTTPRPIPLLKAILAEPTTVVTRGRTLDNAANLAASFLKRIVDRYQGTRLGRQELDAEILADIEGALWSRAQLDADRLRAPPLNWRRKAVAVDPPVTSGEDADECGIIVGGTCLDGKGYVIADCSSQGETPNQWARRAIKAYYDHDCDVLVAEVNNGGEMIETVVKAIDPKVNFRAVHASHGKITRAEPISALYEQHRIHHVGTFARLEDQMCIMTTDFDQAAAGFSPDRVDALVWLMTELMLGKRAEPRIRRL
jgi:phage terminase large subunit-like protein